MALSNMQVFNQYYQPAIIEELSQMVDKFNEASRGAIQLTTDGFDGDFLQRSFFSALHSARRRVDRYASNGTVSSTSLAQTKESAVKVAGGFGPILFEPGQMTWLQKPTGEAIAHISKNFAEAMMQDQLNTAIAALVAALSVASDSKYDGIADVSPNVGISYSTINKSHAKFGDHSNSLVCEVMTGSVFHKLIGQNLTNTNQLFTAGNVTVVDILGKAVVVTDAPALYEDASPLDKEKVLSLVEGAAVVFDGGDMIANIETSNGKSRIETTFQADYTFGLALKGYTWDTTSGGKSPTDAELATGSNWDRTATSVKHTAGVIAIGDATVA
jgi:hypothetical protein